MNQVYPASRASRRVLHTIAHSAARCLLTVVLAVVAGLFTWGQAGAQVPVAQAISGAYATDLSADGETMVAFYQNSFQLPARVVVYTRTPGSNWTPRDSVDYAGVTMFFSSLALSADGAAVAVGSSNYGPSAHPRGGAVLRYGFDATTGTLASSGDFIDGAVANASLGSKLSLSADGTQLAVAAAGNYNTPPAVYTYDLTAPVAAQTGAFPGAVGSSLGFSASLSDDGTRLAFGSHVAKEAYVYTRASVGAAWTLLATLDSDDPNGAFGRSVVLSGNGLVLAVGAPTEDSRSAERGGRVYTYAVDATGVTPLARPIGGNFDDDFIGGELRLSRDGTTLAMGPACGNGGSPPVPAGRVYRREGRAWQELLGEVDVEIRCSNGAVFGRQEAPPVSADGRLVLLRAAYGFASGAPRDQVRLHDYEEVASAGRFIGEPAERRGRGTRLSADGERLTVLSSTAITTYARRVDDRGRDFWEPFGAPVAVAGNDVRAWDVDDACETVAIGNDRANGNVGVVAVYRWDGSTYALAQEIADSSGLRERFGRSVALSADGSRLCVGSYDQVGATNPTEGDYLYDFDGTNYVRVAGVMANSGDFVGREFLLSGDGRYVVTSGAEPNRFVEVARVDAAGVRTEVTRFTGAFLGAFDPSAIDYAGRTLTVRTEGDGQPFRYRTWRRSGQTWTEVGDLLVPYVERPFQTMLNGDGTRLAFEHGIQRPGQNTVPPAGTQVSVYDAAGTNWVLSARDTFGTGHEFLSGFGMARQGHRLAIGHPDFRVDYGPGTGSRGKVTVLELATPEHPHSIVADYTEERLGYAVGLNHAGDVAIVAGGGPSQGAQRIRLARRDVASGEWSLTQEVFARVNAGGVDENAGSHVAIDSAGTRVAYLTWVDTSAGPCCRRGYRLHVATASPTAIAPAATPQGFPLDVAGFALAGAAPRVFVARNVNGANAATIQAYGLAAGQLNPEGSPLTIAGFRVRALQADNGGRRVAVGLRPIGSGASEVRVYALDPATGWTQLGQALPHRSSPLPYTLLPEPRSFALSGDGVTLATTTPTGNRLADAYRLDAAGQWASLTAGQGFTMEWPGVGQHPVVALDYSGERIAASDPTASGTIYVADLVNGVFVRTRRPHRASYYHGGEIGRYNRGYGAERLGTSLELAGSGSVWLAGDPLFSVAIGSQANVYEEVGRIQFADLPPAPVSGANVPLPVELLTFDARDRGAHVAVTWRTSDERDNAGFAVERSATGGDWSEIAWVASRASAGASYQHEDREPLAGLSYYRLRQRDRDGAETLSEVVAVRRGSADPALRLFPNPTRGQLTLTGGGDGPVRLRVSSLSGAPVHAATLSPGGALDLAATLPPGTYVVQLVSAAGSATQLITLQ